MTDKQPDKVERTPDYVEKYANNVRFESSVWDLKLLFGTLDQSTAPLTVRQNLGVILPWAQVKVVLYFSLVNLCFQEATNGPADVPPGLAPPAIDTQLDETARNDPKLKTALERIERLRQELFNV